MNRKQRESTAKYLYDISKGIFLLAVIANMVQGKGGIPTLIFGFIGAFAFFLGAYILEGGIKNE